MTQKTGFIDRRKVIFDANKLQSFQFKPESHAGQIKKKKIL